MLALTTGATAPAVLRGGPAGGREGGSKLAGLVGRPGELALATPSWEPEPKPAGVPPERTDEALGGRTDGGPMRKGSAGALDTAAVEAGTLGMADSSLWVAAHRTSASPTSWGVTLVTGAMLAGMAPAAVMAVVAGLWRWGTPRGGLDAAGADHPIAAAPKLEETADMPELPVAVLVGLPGTQRWREAASPLLPLSWEDPSAL